MSPLKIFSEYWELIVGVCTAIASALGWWTTRKKKEAESSELLYHQLEALKKKVILQVGIEVEQAATLGEAQKIIEALKSHCPECYEAVIKNRAE